MEDELKEDELRVSLARKVALSAYAVTVLHSAAHPTGATRFVEFLLGPQALAIIQEHRLATMGQDPASAPQ